MKTNVSVKTKLDKKGASHITALVLDWTKVTKEQIMPLAQDSAVITLQGRWRRAKTIPKTLTVDMGQFIAELGSRQVIASVEGIAAVASTMSAEERKALLAQLQALDKQQKVA